MTTAESFTIKIETDPPGYSEGTFGYLVSRGTSLWCDGGYATAAHARAAAKKLVRALGAA